MLTRILLFEGNWLKLRATNKMEQVDNALVLIGQSLYVQIRETIEIYRDTSLSVA